MNEQNQVLVCKVCDYYVGFKVNSVHQIIKTQQVKFNKKRSAVKFRNKNIPLFDLAGFLKCKQIETKFTIILIEKTRLLAIPVSNVEDLIPYNYSNYAKETAEKLKNFFSKPYAEGVAIFDNKPIVVVSIKHLLNFAKREKH